MGQVLSGNQGLEAIEPQPISTDPKHIVVCGAGVVGSSTALFLALRGHTVTCLDARAGPAEGINFASFRNGGLICPSLSNPWVSKGSALSLLRQLGSSDKAAIMHLEPRAMFDMGFVMFGAKAASSLMFPRNYDKGDVIYRIGKYSATFMEAELASGARHCNKTAKGTVELVHTQHALDTQSLAGPLAGKRTVEQARKLVPYINPDVEFAGALFSPEDSSADVFKFNQHLVRRGQKLNVNYHYNCKVDTLETDGDRVVAVRTEDGRTFPADVTVLALGVHTGNVARKVGVYVPILPVKGYALKVPYANPSSQRLSYNLVHDANKLYICPIGDGVNISSRAEVSGIDPSVDQEVAQKILQRAEDLIPGVLDLSRAHAHTCHRPVSPDDVPIIGRAPGFENLFVNAGHGSKGWTQCMGSGAMLAHLIDGTECPLDPTPFSPERFRLSAPVQSIFQWYYSG